MRLLLVGQMYPSAGREWEGACCERIAVELQTFCDLVEVVAPRPYAPPLVSSLSPRWKTHRGMPRRELRKGLKIHRPAYLQIPRIGNGAAVDLSLFYLSKRMLADRHRESEFHAVLSLGLMVAGSLGWRLANLLGIPSAGWAVGSDVRLATSTSVGRSVARALANLDLVFFQSRELLERGVELIGHADRRVADDRFSVLSHGIPPAPELPSRDVRDRMRARLGIPKGDTLLVSTGRVVEDKGVFDLLEALSVASSTDPGLRCVLVGSRPGLDDTHRVRRRLRGDARLARRVRLEPACPPERVWEYLAAADVFVFPSHKEGMPNSLLEAMAANVPAVAYGIPPILELDGGEELVEIVAPRNVLALAGAILALARNPELGRRMARRARIRIRKQHSIGRNLRRAVARLEDLR